MGAQRLISLEDSFKHVAVIGASGSGKSSRFFVPGIMSLTNQNSLVTDIDGRLFYETAHLKQQQQGYTIKVLNLMNNDNSDQFNPLRHLSLNVNCDKYLNGFFDEVGGQSKGDNSVFLEGGKAIATFALKLLIYEFKNNQSNCPPSFPALYKKVMSLNYETLKNFRGYFIELRKQDMNNVDLNKVFDCLELANKENAKEYSSCLFFAQQALKPLAEEVFDRTMSNDDAIFNSIADRTKKPLFI